MKKVSVLVYTNLRESLDTIVVTELPVVCFKSLNVSVAVSIAEQ